MSWLTKLKAIYVKIEMKARVQMFIVDFQFQQVHSTFVSSEPAMTNFI